MSLLNCMLYFDKDFLNKLSIHGCWHRNHLSVYHNSYFIIAWPSWSRSRNVQRFLNLISYLTLDWSNCRMWTKYAVHFRQFCSSMIFRFRAQNKNNLMFWFNVCVWISLWFQHALSRRLLYPVLMYLTNEWKGYMSVFSPVFYYVCPSAILFLMC